jgi:hypothetical protein
VESPDLDSVRSKLQNGESLDAEDLDRLVNAISERSREAGRQAAREEFETRQTAVTKQQERWTRVEQFMAEKFPESVNFTEELALFVQAHPLIGAGVQALIAQDRHEEATAAAWEAYVSQGGGAKTFVPAPATKENIEKEIRLDAADQVRQEAVAQARRDAGIMGSTAGARGVHENANAGPTDDEWNGAVAQYHQGDGSKWRSLVFRDALNHPIFGP